MHRSPKLFHKTTKCPWKIVFGGAYEAPRGRDFPLHSHTQWEWVYYRTGFIQCLHGVERLPMRPGALWMTPPGVPHAEFARTAYSNFFFQIEGPRHGQLPKVIHDDAEGSIGRLLRVLLMELRRCLPEEKSMVPHVTAALALLIQRSQEKSSPTGKTGLVGNAESLWEDEPLLSVGEVARRLGVSVSGLRQSFQSERGRSPVECRMQWRVERAVRLLQSSTLKLEAVAELSGFHSASHLSRCVKAATGNRAGRLRSGPD
jgi:AraC-like DNA-binding protein